jgi:hypothetical protein
MDFFGIDPFRRCPIIWSFAGGDEKTGLGAPAWAFAPGTFFIATPFPDTLGLILLGR